MVYTILFVCHHDGIRKGEKEVKDLEDWASVQKVYKQTKSKRATASILGISRNTVKRLLSMTEAPVYHRTKYSSKIDPYKEQIIEWRCEPYDFNGTRIFRELKNWDTLEASRRSTVF